jgi:hypothetical protein
MVRTHPSTPDQRAHWASQMITHAGNYGFVTALSHQVGVSRQTLYTWRATALHALQTAFTPNASPPPLTPELERHILTVLLEGHASARGIQACLRTLTQQRICLETIVAVLAEAQRRARVWMVTHVPPSVRALALDEIYANDHRRAYLNVVDIHSGAVWASEGLLEADAESWTLLLWELQDRHLYWDRVATDGARAMHEACVTVTPQIAIQRDIWHVLHRCAQVQGRLDRRVVELEGRTAGIERQAARLAAGKPLPGKRVRGRPMQADVAAHSADVAAARRRAADLRFLTSEMRRLLEAVVLDQRGILTPTQRQVDLDAVLTLLAELVTTLPAAQQAEVRSLHTYLSRALPDLLHFVPQLAEVQQDLLTVLPAEQQVLLAWAWLRRHRLDWTSADLVERIPESWRAAARVLLAAWDDAVRVSSAVERWHSIMRPHLVVHRRLSSGMLALLVVWHNHRVFSRGVHKGKNPLHLSGMSDAPTDWLVALGYPPASAAVEQPYPSSKTGTLALAA